MMLAGNGIEMEVLTADDIAELRQFASIVPTTAWRTSNGSWTVVAKVVLSLTLPDGRVIEVRKSIILKGKQKGRKPRVRRTQEV